MIGGLLAEQAAREQPCVLATVVRCEPPTSAHPGDKAVITADGRLQGWIGGSCAEAAVRREALRALAEGSSRLVLIGPEEQVGEARSGEVTMATSCPSGGTLELFLEPRLPAPLLVVFGQSPAARTLVELAATVGFRISAVHPGAVRRDFPGADQVLADLDLGPLPSGPDSWAVVATMGHYDEDALQAALGRPGMDVALVASAPRAAAVLSSLRGRGVAAEDLARIRTPAGGRRAGRPEEIALLALAEVVELRQRRRAAAKRTADVPVEPGFATDPVCGMTVDRESLHRAAHDGAMYFFCCAACREQFLSDPAHHLAAERSR